MNKQTSELISRIKNSDDAIRGPAWQGAAQAGSDAVQPLAALMADTDFETARCARRALYKIVRYVGRPGAEHEAQEVTRELILQLKSPTVSIRREMLWMLSEIGGEEAIVPMANLLKDPEVCEDARCALMRLPSPQVTAALHTAFLGAPEEFKPALAESLRQRGQKVEGYPSQKRVPSRKTAVGPGMSK